MPFTGPLADRIAIRELLDAYSDAVNLADAQLWGALWSEESVWELPDYPQIGELHGRDAILAVWVKTMTQFPGVIFVTTPGSIEVEGQTAKVRCYTSEIYDRDGVTRRDCGRYDDVVVCEGGIWRFRLRRFRSLHRA